MRKRLKLDLSMHAMLQILSVSLFEKTPLYELLTLSVEALQQPIFANQLNLLD